MPEKPVAVVTGGNRGIGKAIALELARIGFHLVINYRGSTVNGVSSSEKAVTAQREIASLGATCRMVQADIGNSSDRKKLIDFVKEKFNRCHLLVNNAGVAPLNRTDILEVSEESYDRVMNINLKGPYFLSQLFANWMIQQKKKKSDQAFRIVNISSISAYTVSSNRGEYCISKAGMSMMTQLFADRLAENGVGVFEVRPGLIATDMTKAAKDKYDKLIAQGLTPIRRWGQPEDVGHAVAALAEGRLDFSPGQVINVDGGFHLHRL